MNATRCVSVVAADATRFLKPGTDPASFLPELGRKFNPSQPRVAAGNPDGGRWTVGNVGVVDALEARDDPLVRILLRKRSSNC